MSTNVQRLKELLTEALALPPAERAAFVERSCSHDAALRDELEQLIKAHESAGDFLEQSAVPPESDFHILACGDFVGRYKLLQEIGEGGFGRVFMAEQTEPVHRKVALKIVKAGMDTREVIARFEAERQALALMEHPNIARIFDAGMTGKPVTQASPPASLAGVPPGVGSGGGTPPKPAGEDARATLCAGRPYFVMELVRGIPITDYCDREQLATPERLRLFMQVCHAVQHAHQKGIIHRDLKPTNILVTMIDGQPVPKIIDFGVAKALGQRLTEKTLFTRFEEFLGTPAYMSPEQAELSGVDVDTRSDIYALGVLLYELLTGVTPFDAETFRKAALDEVRRIIRQVEPPKPSTRLRSLGDKLTDVAQHRQVEPTALPRLMHGDLDWIVMKCLEKDRARRYETANSLATDIGNYLEHRTVLASPPGTFYRAGKFIRRHRMGVTMAASVATVLLAGLVVSLVAFANAARERDHALVAEAEAQKQRDRAEAEQHKAKTEAARSAQVARFMKDMLQAVGPGVAQGRDTTLLREILDQTAQRIGRELTNQPEVELELCNAVGDAYQEIGLYAKAESSFRRALELTRKLYDHDSPEVANALHRFAEYLRRYAKITEAEKTEREALAIYRKLYGDESPEVGVALGCLFLTISDLHEGREAEAEAMGRQALALNERLLGGDHPEVGLCLNRLGGVLTKEGKLAEAESMLRRAVNIQQNALTNQYRDQQLPEELPWALHGLAVVLHQEGKLDEAERFAREALGVRKTVQGETHRDILDGTLLLISVLLDENKSAEAQTMLNDLLARLQKPLPPNDAGLAYSLVDFARVLRKHGKLADAEAICRKAFSMTQGMSTNDARIFAYALVNLASVLYAQGKPAEAEPLYRQTLSIYRSIFSHDDSHVANTVINLAAVLHAQGKPAEAEPLFREALSTYRKLYGNDHPNVAYSLASLAAVLRAQGKLTEAESITRELVERKDPLTLNYLAWQMATSPDPNVRDGPKAVAFAEQAVAGTSRTNANYLDTLAAAYAEMGDFPKAISVQQEAIALLHPEEDKQGYKARLKLYQSGSPVRE